MLGTECPFYTHVKNEDLAVFKPTLRHMVIFEPLAKRSPQAKTEEFMKIVVEHFGNTLEIFGLTTENWKTIKPMKVLRELYVCCDFYDKWIDIDNLVASIANQRDCNPPSLGINAAVTNNTDFDNLLVVALREGNVQIIERLVKDFGIDPNRLSGAQGISNYRSSPVLNAFGSGWPLHVPFSPSDLN